VARQNLTIIGSGKTGFSLSPHKFGAVFCDESDIDVVVVSEEIFDALWLELLRFPRYRLKQLREWERDRIEDHEHEIFWGRIWPHHLLAVSSRAKRWIRAFRSVS
jgi:hypothetical protein